MIGYLDECVQRCLKTPHRYIEDLERMAVRDGADEDKRSQQTVLSSPLLVTVGEQYIAKLNGGHFTPSDALSVTTFIRKLVLVLGSKLEDLTCLDRMTEKVVRAVEGSISSLENSPVVAGAIRREVGILSACLRSYREGPIQAQIADTSERAVQEFLDQLEALPIREWPSTRTRGGNMNLTIS